MAVCSPPHRIKISRLLFSFCQCLPSAPLISFGTIWYQNIKYFHYLLLCDQWIYNHMTIATWSPKYSSQARNYWKYTLFLVFATFLFYSNFESIINFQVIKCVLFTYSCIYCIFLFCGSTKYHHCFKYLVSSKIQKLLFILLTFSHKRRMWH